jgi:hypothetical protein
MPYILLDMHSRISFLSQTKKKNQDNPISFD